VFINGLQLSFLVTTSEANAVETIMSAAMKRENFISPPKG
jgi:hypothetical protein